MNKNKLTFGRSHRGIKHAEFDHRIGPIQQWAVPNL